MRKLLFALKRQNQFTNSHTLLAGGFIYAFTVPSGLSTVYFRAQGRSGDAGPATAGSKGGGGGGAGGSIVDVPLSVVAGEVYTLTAEVQPAGWTIWYVRKNGSIIGYFHDGQTATADAGGPGGGAELLGVTADPNTTPGFGLNGAAGEILAASTGYVVAGGYGGSGANISPPGAGGWGGSYGGSNLGGPPTSYWGGGGGGFYANGVGRLSDSTTTTRVAASATIFW